MPKETPFNVNAAEASERSTSGTNGDLTAKLQEWAKYQWEINSESMKSGTAISSAQELAAVLVRAAAVLRENGPEAAQQVLTGAGFTGRLAHSLTTMISRTPDSAQQLVAAEPLDRWHNQIGVPTPIAETSENDETTSPPDEYAFTDDADEVEVAEPAEPGLDESDELADTDETEAFVASAATQPIRATRENAPTAEARPDILKRLQERRQRRRGAKEDAQMVAERLAEEKRLREERLRLDQEFIDNPQLILQDPQVAETLQPDALATDWAQIVDRIEQVDQVMAGLEAWEEAQRNDPALLKLKNDLVRNQELLETAVNKKTRAGIQAIIDSNLDDIRRRRLELMAEQRPLREFASELDGTDDDLDAAEQLIVYDQLATITALASDQQAALFIDGNDAVAGSPLDTNRHILSRDIEKVTPRLIGKPKVELATAPVSLQEVADDMSLFDAAVGDPTSGEVIIRQLQEKISVMRRLASAIRTYQESQVGQEQQRITTQETIEHLLQELDLLGVDAENPELQAAAADLRNSAKAIIEKLAHADANVRDKHRLKYLVNLKETDYNLIVSYADRKTGEVVVLQDGETLKLADGEMNNGKVKTVIILDSDHKEVKRAKVSQVNIINTDSEAMDEARTEAQESLEKALLERDPQIVGFARSISEKMILQMAYLWSHGDQDQTKSLQYLLAAVPDNITLGRFQDVDDVLQGIETSLQQNPEELALYLLDALIVAYKHKDALSVKQQALVDKLREEWEAINDKLDYDFKNSEIYQIQTKIYKALAENERISDSDKQIKKTHRQAILLAQAQATEKGWQNTPPGEFALLAALFDENSLLWEIPAYIEAQGTIESADEGKDDHDFKLETAVSQLLEAADKFVTTAQAQMPAETATEVDESETTGLDSEGLTTGTEKVSKLGQVARRVTNPIANAQNAALEYWENYWQNQPAEGFNLLALLNNIRKGVLPGRPPRTVTADGTNIDSLLAQFGSSYLFGGENAPEAGEEEMAQFEADNPRVAWYANQIADREDSVFGNPLPNRTMSNGEAALAALSLVSPSEAAA